MEEMKRRQGHKEACYIRIEARKGGENSSEYIVTCHHIVSKYINSLLITWNADCTDLIYNQTHLESYGPSFLAKNLIGPQLETNQLS